MTSAGSNRAVVVIPAYDPTTKLVELVEDLSRDGRRIIVFDDGSAPAFRGIFNSVAACQNTTVLSHAVNLHQDIVRRSRRSERRVEGLGDHTRKAGFRRGGDIWS